MTEHEAMQRIDQLLSHVWVVRTFLKHCDEAEDDEDLQDVFRTLYDCCMAVGPAWQNQDAPAYLKQVRKKLNKLKAAEQMYREIQPEVSTHTNFQMAATSLSASIADIEQALSEVAAG